MFLFLQSALFSWSYNCLAFCLLRQFVSHQIIYMSIDFLKMPKPTRQCIILLLLLFPRNTRPPPGPRHPPASDLHPPHTIGLFAFYTCFPVPPCVILGSAGDRMENRVRRLGASLLQWGVWMSLSYWSDKTESVWESHCTRATQVQGDGLSWSSAHSCQSFFRGTTVHIPTEAVKTMTWDN